VHSGGDDATTATMEALNVQRDARVFTRGLTPEVQLVNALWQLVGDETEVEVHTGQIKEAIAGQSTDASAWCNETWMGKTLRRLHIWRSARDSRRERAIVSGEGGTSGPKLLTHYRIKRERLPER